MAAIKTPCINVCALDDATGLCRGCGRTRDEVAVWSVIGDSERERIMAELPRRMVLAFPATRSATAG
jgi:predicted Fe-S protein YdhL (DUF1289 family)